MSQTSASSSGMSSGEPAQCKNCDAVLLGKYCVNCSQAADVHVLTTAELLHELLEGLTHSDSRLWRTLTSLWFRPGTLTREYVAGRRMAYLPPFRLYLVLSVIFFLIAPHVQTHPDTGPVVQTSEAPESTITLCANITFEALAGHPEWNERIRHVCKEVVRDNGNNLMHLALGTLSKAMFIFLPLIAFFHMLMYWRPRYRYAEHLLFFVHLHAFFFSAAIVMLAGMAAAREWPRLQGLDDALESLLDWTAVIYTIVAVRRVFTASWAAALLKTAALAVVYMAVFAVTLGGVFVYVMLQL